MMVYSKCEADTELAGERLAARLSAGAAVALDGGLGAGKTAFTRGIARGLGYTGRVTSPTFAIVAEYPSSPPLFHFDAYRLSSAEELYDLGLDDYLERGGICVIEWSELVADALPADSVRVRITRTGECEREITIDG